MKGTSGPRIIANTKISLYLHGLGGAIKGTGTGDPRSILDIKISLYFHGLGGMVKGASGFRITEINTKSVYFHGLGGVVKGAGSPRIISKYKDFFVLTWFEPRGERGRSQNH